MTSGPKPMTLCLGPPELSALWGTIGAYLALESLGRADLGILDDLCDLFASWEEGETE